MSTSAAGFIGFPEAGLEFLTELQANNRRDWFGADKQPYRTSIAMMFTGPDGKRMEIPGFGVQISPNGVELVAGIFRFDKVHLDRYRDLVIAEDSGLELETAHAAIRDAGPYRVEGKTYKRVPAGYDPAHPRAEHLLYSGLHVFGPVLPARAACAADLVDRLMERFEAMSPVERWLQRWCYARQRL